MSKAIDWSKAPEWADRVVLGPLSKTRWWASETRRLNFNGEFGGRDDCHIRENWQVVVRRPAAWNGEGLPPVGLEIEVLFNCPPAEYVTAKVIGHDEGKAVYRFVTGGRKGEYESDVPGLFVGRPELPLFRPIRTPEQIAAEERAKAIADMEKEIGPGFHSPERAAECLYSAGYRKFEIVDEKA